MGKGGTNTAAVEVDDVFAMAQGKDDALVKSIRALRVEQAKLPQEIEAIALSGEVTAQAPARGVADLELLDQGGILQSALVEITHRFGVVIELLAIDSGRLLEDRGGRVVCRSGRVLQVGE